MIVRAMRARLLAAYWAEFFYLGGMLWLHARGMLSSTQHRRMHDSARRLKAIGEALS